MKGYGKRIIYCGQKLLLCCDGNCNKAWGMNSRPQVAGREDEDEPWYLSDDELGIAPLHPGTWEGGHGKPNPADPEMNKWCARECERSTMTALGDPIKLPVHTGKGWASVEVDLTDLTDKGGSWQ